jgi:hypothetical protein
MAELELKPSTSPVWLALIDVLIVGGMVACTVIALVQIGQQIVPAWNAAYIPPYCFFIAIEAAISTHLMGRAWRPRPRYAARFVELFILVLTTRSLLGLIRGPAFAIGAGVFRSAADNELAVLIIVVAFAWLLSWQLTRCSIEIDGDAGSVEREALKEVSDMRALARDTLSTTILLIGLAMVTMAALIRLSLRNAGLEADAAALPIGHILIYFALGLFLASKARLAMMRSGWQLDGVPIGRSLPARWMGYTLILLIVITLIAIVLPTQNPLGLFGTLSYLVQLILFLVQMLWYAVMLILSSLLSVFFPQLPQPIAPQPPPPPQPFPPPDANAGALPTISEFAQSLIFWLIFLIVAGYVIYQYAEHHPEIVRALQRIPGWSLIARLWQRTRQLFGRLNQHIATALEARRQARSAAPTPSRRTSQRWSNLRRLAPREQVQFYYQALLRRSDEHGLARRPAQTPHEYARDLRSHLPEVEPDVTTITDEFIEARYSRHDITPEHVGLVRRCWASIKRALRRGRMKDEG